VWRPSRNHHTSNVITAAKTREILTRHGRGMKKQRTSGQVAHGHSGPDLHKFAPRIFDAGYVRSGGNGPSRRRRVGVGRFREEAGQPFAVPDATGRKVAPAQPLMRRPSIQAGADFSDLFQERRFARDTPKDLS
jgi:hypothetical protein